MIITIITIIRLIITVRKIFSSFTKKEIIYSLGKVNCFKTINVYKQ